MANIAVILKTEIARIARKELRAEVEPLKKAQSAHRSEIAALKRRIQSLEKAIKALGRAQKSAAKPSRGAEPKVASDEATSRARFSAKAMASNRQHLGLSAADFGRLIGATGQSVYQWEAGKAIPRSASLAAIAALRGIGKREVAARLEAIRESA